jgi:hypothetical protein
MDEAATSRRQKDMSPIIISIVIVQKIQKNAFGVLPRCFYSRSLK